MFNKDPDTFPGANDNLYVKKKNSSSFFNHSYT